MIRFAARGPDRFDGALTTLHQKSWIFSSTGDSKRVSLITSHNATYEARDHQFNDGYQFVGNEKVYNTLRDVFVEQSKDNGGANPFRKVRLSDTVALWFSPWNSPAMSDPVIERIQGLPDSHLTIRIANAAWADARGVPIAREVAAKARAGAKVFVLASRPFSGQVRAILSNAGIPVHEGYFSDNSYHHLKFMTARWGTGEAVKTRVWTGSENWSNESRGSDELVVSIGAGTTHADWVRFFNSLYDR